MREPVPSKEQIQDHFFTGAKVKSKRAMRYREGFWRSSKGDEGELPWPVEVGGWVGKNAFLKALEAAENRAHETAYRGWSACRICQCTNGSREYELDGWCWPEGYSHYISRHNVRPSLAFQEFILGAELEKPIYVSRKAVDDDKD